MRDSQIILHAAAFCLDSGESIALIGRPALLIADDPAARLDPIEAADIMGRLTRRLGPAIDGLVLAICLAGNALTTGRQNHAQSGRR